MPKETYIFICTESYGAHGVLTRGFQGNRKYARRRAIVRRGTKGASMRQRERMEIQVLSLNYYSRKSRILEAAVSRVRWNTQ